MGGWVRTQREELVGLVIGMACGVILWIMGGGLSRWVIV